MEKVRSLPRTGLILQTNRNHLSTSGDSMKYNILWWSLAIIIGLMAAYAPYAKAETNLFVGAWSEHLISGDNLNEQHDLIAVEHNQWFAGRFINSYERETFAVAHKFKWSY